MKTKFTIFLILIFIASFYLFNGLIINSVKKPETITKGVSGVSDTIQTGSNSFLIGALDCGYDSIFRNLDSSGFNLWHAYSSGNYGWKNIGAPGDSLYAGINTYRAGVQNKLEAISSHGMKSIIHRPKIAMLCYGQRSDYQCEEIPLSDDLWFYSFQSPTHAGIDTNETWQGQSQRVRYCRRNIQTTDGGAGWVVSKLKSNTEQCFSYSAASGISADPIKNWIIKPRIRIDSTLADDTTNWNMNVCKIKVIGQRGDTVLKEINIIVKDFLKSFNYDGRYLDEYNFTGGKNLEINGYWGDLYFNGARGNSTIDSANKIDIQIYWYGNCDMWIDYVRVDNMVAHRLLSGNDDQFNDWLQWESQDIACHNESAIKFYLELFSFANIPCMSYVSRKLDSLAYSYCGRHISLMCIPIPFFYAAHVPWSDRRRVWNPASQVNKYLIQEAGLKTYFSNVYAGGNDIAKVN